MVLLGVALLDEFPFTVEFLLAVARVVDESAAKPQGLEELSVYTRFVLDKVRFITILFVWRSKTKRVDYDYTSLLKTLPTSELPPAMRN